MTLDFGLLIHSTPRGGTVPAMLATNEKLLARAIEHNFSAWFVDHFQFGDGPLLECLAMLAHTAGRFPTLRTGTLVLGQGYRNPALTAKIASTLQFLTGGRFTLGIGAGWKEDEYRSYGYPYPPAKQRIAELEEAIQIIRALWMDAPASFSGDYYSVTNAYNEPRPDPAPILMIGGAGEQHTLRVVAKYADWWNADYYTPDDYAHKLDVLHGYCREIGRDHATLTPTYYAGVSLSYNPAEIIARPPIQYRPNMYTLHGTPDEVTAQMEQFAAIGVQLMQLNFLDYPRTTGMDLFFSEVFPRFKGK